MESYEGSGEDASSTMGTAGSILPVGTSHRFTSDTAAVYQERTHSVVSAHLSDGWDQVILDAWI